MADENVNNKTAAKNAAKSAQDLKKQKKKKWCPIVAPELFYSKVIGESLLDDASMLMGRTVTVNMMQLLGDVKRQNINIMFKVTDVKEGKGLTQAVQFEISSSSIKRLAKRERDKISDSFVVKTLDGKMVRLKPLMITNNLAKGGVTAELIKLCRIVSKEIVNKITFDNLISDLVSYKFQRDVKSALHRTYPLRTFEIRMLNIENRKKKETVEEEMLLKMKKERDAADAEKRDEEQSSEQIPPSKTENSDDSEETVDNAEEQSEDTEDDQ